MSGQRCYNTDNLWMPDEVEEAQAAAARGDTGTYSSTGLWTPGTTVRTTQDGGVVQPNVHSAGQQGVTDPNSAPGWPHYIAGIAAPPLAPTMLPPMAPQLVPAMTIPMVPHMLPTMAPTLVRPMVTNATHRAGFFPRPQFPMTGQHTINAPTNAFNPVMQGGMAGSRGYAPTPVQQHLPSNLHQGSSVGNFNQLSLGNLNFVPDSRHTVWALRGHGKDIPNISIYNIINCTDMSVIGALVVNEDTEIVELRDSTGLHILTATRGLKNMQSMNVTTPLNLQIAIINNKEIKIFQPSSCLDIQPTLVNGRRNLQIHRQGQPYCVALISAREDTLRVGIHGPLPNVISAVILLYALKMFYLQFQLHTLAMPRGILSNMPPGSFKPMYADLAILHSLAYLRVRISCHVEDGFFVDFLDMNTDRIVLVASTSNGTTLFMDPLGRIHFTAITTPTSMQLKPPEPSRHTYGMVPGSMNDDTRFLLDCNNQKLLRLERRLVIVEEMIEESQETLSRVIFFSPDVDEYHGGVYPDHFTIGIKMVKSISHILKAGILGTAMQMATFHYKIWRQLNPKVQGYQFAK